MKAMVLAAGRGERLRPLTDTLPKPLVPVRGKPLIGWHLESLARAAIEEVVINLWWLGDQIRAYVGDGSAWGLRVRYSQEGPEPLDTGGGIFRALPLLGSSPFVLVNGDIFTSYDFGRLRLGPHAFAHLVLVPNTPDHPRGDFGLENGLLTEGEIQTQRYTYAGIGIYSPNLFSGCQEGRFGLTPILHRAASAQRLSGELYPGPWADLGTAERLAALNKGGCGGESP
jgi:N-acetyl-alpha-D-muramate 1-phosphate uridylyltransferase